MTVSISNSKAYLFRTALEQNEFNQDGSKNKIKCLDRFYKESDLKVKHEIIARRKSYQIKYAVSIGIAGGIFGGFLGGVILRHPIGVFGGAAIGAGIGMSIGVNLGKSHHNLTILKSKVYNTWKDAILDQRTYRYFLDFIESRKEFSDFLCPIGANITVVPIKTPCGHIYEAENLKSFLYKKLPAIDVEIQALKEKNLPQKEMELQSEKIKKGCCQFNCMYFTFDQCTIDEIRMKKIHDVIKNIMSSSSELSDDNIVAEGLKAIQGDLHANHSDIVGEQAKDIVQQMIAMDLDPEKAADIFKEIYKQEKWNCNHCHSLIRKDIQVKIEPPSQEIESSQEIFEEEEIELDQEMVTPSEKEYSEDSLRESVSAVTLKPEIEKLESIVEFPNEDSIKKIDSDSDNESVMSDFEDLEPVANV